MNGEFAALRSPYSQRVTAALLLAGPVVLSLIVGAAIVWNPILAALPIAMLASALLLADGRLRTLFIVIGALAIFQSSEELSPLKAGYLLGVGVCFLGAIHRVAVLRTSDAYRVALPLVRISLAFVALIFVSLPVATATGIPKIDWLRDAAPYVFFALAPLFALDAQSSMTKRALERLLVLAGIVAAVSLAVTWIERREIAELPIARFAFPSLLLAAALFAYATAHALEGPARRGRWIALAALVLTLAVVTGSRVNLLLLVAPLAIAVGARRHLARRTVRLAVAGPILVGIMLIAFQSAVNLTGGRESVLVERQALLFSIGDERIDQSYTDRTIQAEAAWDVFAAHPFLGVGLGYRFEWTDAAGAVQSSFNPDTFVTFLANFGSLGIIAIAIFVIGYISFLRSLARNRPARIPYLTLIGHTAVIGAVAFQAPPFEEKGLALALLLLLALALREVSQPSVRSNHGV